MSAIVSVYAVFAGREEAERIGRIAVEEKLAACVNILAPCTSIYRWQGQVEESSEVPAIFKTSSDLGSRLVARIAQLHSYDVPAIALWPIADTLSDYSDWVVASTD